MDRVQKNSNSVTYGILVILLIWLRKPLSLMNSKRCLSELLGPLRTIFLVVRSYSKYEGLLVSFIILLSTSYVRLSADSSLSKVIKTIILHSSFQNAIIQRAGTRSIE